MANERTQKKELTVEEIISKKMIPLYWIIGGSMALMLTIYVSIALPISSKVMELNTEVKSKINSEDVKKDYLTKGTFLFLQNQCHEFDIDAIRNPNNADLIYNKEITEAAKALDYVSRGSTIN